MSGLKVFATSWLHFTVFIVLVSEGRAILSRPPCREENLQIICECDYSQRNLEIPAFTFANTHDTATSITVQNCGSVTIGSKSIERLRNLRHLYIRNVAELRLQESSFYWDIYRSDPLANVPQLAITIAHSTIATIPNYAFSGKLSELRLENVTTGTVSPFAFSSITRLRVLELKRSHFKQVQAQAFKKIETETFLVIDSRFGTLPSRAVADVEVTDVLRVVNSEFDIVRPGALMVTAPRTVEILQSRFNSVESDALKIRAKGNVVFRNNTFFHLQSGAFKGISLLKEPRAAYTKVVLFANNILPEFNADAIAFNRSSFTPDYQTVIVNTTCACSVIHVWKASGQWHEEIYCLVVAGRGPMKTIKSSVFYADHCETGSNFWLILGLVIAGLLVFLVLLVLVIVYFYRRYKLQKQKEYVTRGRTKNGSLGLIVPDGRTYRETEVHVIVEKAELLTTEL